MPAQGALPRASKGAWGVIASAGATEGKQNRGGTLDDRPCPHADRDTAEIFGVAGCGVHQGKERHTFGAKLRWTTAKLYRGELLGARVFCFNGGKGRGCCPPVHPRSGKGG